MGRPYFFLLYVVTGLFTAPALAGADEQSVSSNPQLADILNLSALERQQIRAQLSPVRYTTISSEIPARVKKLSVLESGRFKQGQLIVELDCSLQQAQLQKVRAELASSEHIHEANRQLAAMNSVGKLDLELSESGVQKARADVLSVETLLGKCQIEAPFSGRIAEQKIREQQYVQAGQPLLDILDDSELELEFIVPSRWLVWLKPGLKFEVRVDETMQNYPARFTRIGARVDPVSQSVKVAAAIEGNFPELVAGMSGTVNVKVPETGKQN